MSFPTAIICAACLIHILADFAGATGSNPDCIFGTGFTPVSLLTLVAFTIAASVQLWLTYKEHKEQEKIRADLKSDNVTLLMGHLSLQDCISDSILMVCGTLCYITGSLWVLLVGIAIDLFVIFYVVKKCQKEGLIGKKA